jgi:hypothetical protein
MIRRPSLPLSRGIAAMGLLLLSALAGCGGGSPAPRRLALQLTIAAKEPVTRQQMQRGDGRYTAIRFEGQGSDCRGGAGFAAFQASTPVEVQDQAGRLLAEGALGSGRFQSGGRDPEGEVLYTACDFRVVMPLAAAARIYLIRIGGEALVRRLHVSHLRALNGNVSIRID